MRTAAKTTSAVRTDSSGQIDDLIAGFRKKTCGEDADITMFAIEIQVTVAVVVK